MRAIKYCSVIFSIIGVISIYGMQERQKSLEKIYRMGTVRFIPEIVLDDNSMPENVFFERPRKIVSIYIRHNTT